MAEKLLGSYQLERNENFEEFLTATGVPMIPKKMMASTSPSINISKERDKWTLSFKVLMKSNSISFELGKEFEEENPVLGVKQKVIFRKTNLKSYDFISSVWQKRKMEVLQLKQQMRKQEKAHQEHFCQLKRVLLWYVLHNNTIFFLFFYLLDSSS